MRSTERVLRDWSREHYRWHKTFRERSRAILPVCKMYGSNGSGVGVIDTVEFDTLGGANTTDHRVDINADGYYLCHVRRRVVFNGAQAGAFTIEIQANVFISGETGYVEPVAHDVMRLDDTMPNPWTSYVGNPLVVAQATALKHVAAGEYVAVSGAATVIGSSGATFTDILEVTRFA